MAHEIEKKFLLTSDKWRGLAVKQKYFIAQGYIEGDDLDISFAFNQKNEAIFTFADKSGAKEPLKLTIAYNNKSGFAGFLALSQIDRKAGRLFIRDDLVCRIRLRENVSTGLAEAFLTIKAPTDNPDISDEYEEAVDIEPAKAILDNYGSYVVKKHRHVIPVEEFNWEVDVFAGGLQGLVIAEIEVADKALFTQVKPLPNLGQDVTADFRYKNRALGEFGIPKL